MRYLRFPIPRFVCVGICAGLPSLPLATAQSGKLPVEGISPPPAQLDEGPRLRNEAGSARDGLGPSVQKPGNTPELRSFTTKIRKWDEPPEPFDPDDVPKRSQAAPYAPAYDEEGRPLPMILVIRAYVVQRPNLDLSKLRWRLHHAIGENKVGPILLQGDFSSGLEQERLLPPEFVQKVLAVFVEVEQPRQTMIK